MKIKSESIINNLLSTFNTRGIDLSLKRIELVYEEIGKPCHDIPAIQIVGTNGKGSIASFLISSLKKAGIKTGATTSPHLVSWTERICVDSELITLVELHELLTELSPIFQKHRLTSFECLTATALKYFSNKKVSLLVLEVGLGGPLDATSVHPMRPIIAMGSIGIDHCDFLGGTLSEIATEKAGVITEGSTVISASQHPEVELVLKNISASKGADLKWVQPLPKELKLGLRGNIQRQNAAVAKAALETLSLQGFTINENEISDGLSLAKWPGRLQHVSWNNLPLILDGAHNPLATTQLSQERKRWKRQEHGINWIIGIQAHKQGPQMLRDLVMTNDNAWIIPVPEHLSWTKSQFEEACPELTQQLFQAKDFEHALKRIFLLKDSWPTPPPVVVGSLYLLGNLLSQKTITPS